MRELEVDQGRVEQLMRSHGKVRETLVLENCIG